MTEGKGLESPETLEKFREEWDAYRKERNERLHRFFVRVLVIFAVLGLTVSATAYFTYNTADESKEGLCALRNDAERRVILGDQFLKDNPNGIPGISIDSLRRSVRNSKETVKSLSSLSCPPAEIETPSPTATSTEKPR